MESGKLLIYHYLPAALLPADFNMVTFEDFYSLCAAARLIRKMQKEDIKEAVGEVAVELLGEGG